MKKSMDEGTKLHAKLEEEYNAARIKLESDGVCVQGSVPVPVFWGWGEGCRRLQQTQSRVPFCQT